MEHGIGQQRYQKMSRLRRQGTEWGGIVPLWQSGKRYKQLEVRLFAGYSVYCML